MANHLSSEIEAGLGLHVNWYTLLGPLALKSYVSLIAERQNKKDTYSTKFITFKLLWFATPESAFVDQIRQLLLHKFFNLGDSFFKARLCLACNVEVERRVLKRYQQSG